MAMFETFDREGFDFWDEDEGACYLAIYKGRICLSLNMGRWMRWDCGVDLTVRDTLCFFHFLFMVTKGLNG